MERLIRAMQRQMSVQSQKNVVLLGDAGVGKSTFFERLQNLPFRTSYNPTHGSDISVNVKVGDVDFNIYDTAGQEKLQSVKMVEDIVKADAAIVVFDSSFRTTYKRIFWWREMIRDVAGDIPIVIVANKCDMPRTFPIDENILTMSCKTGDGIEEPLAKISRMLE